MNRPWYLNRHEIIGGIKTYWVDCVRTEILYYVIKNWLSILGLTVFSLIIILPPIIYGYIYPTNGVDTATHLAILKSGDYWNQLYYGYFLAYPLKWFGNWNVSFFWFNLVALVLVGYSVYFVLTKLVNYKAGLLGLVSLLLIGGIWSEYGFGEIFNVINIGIIFVWLLYFMVRWYEQRKPHQLIFVYLLAVIFSFVHTSGIYLLPLVIGLLAVYVAYNLLRQIKTDRSVVIVLLGLVVVSGICTYIMLNKTLQVWDVALSGRVPVLPLFIMLTVISPVTVVVIGVTAFTSLRKNTTLIILSLLAVMLFIAAMGVSPHPDKQFYDFATIAGLVMAVLLGLALEKKNSLNYFMVALVIFGVLIGLPNWLGYHSSITLPDKQAIEYLNSLNANTFSCNVDANQYIYGNYIKETYKDNGGGVLIERNVQMGGQLSYTYLTLPESIQGYQLEKTFQQGKVEVEIWQKQ